MPTPTPTMPRHAPRRGFLTMTRPMLAWCRIDECRRCCCRCWSGATSMEAVDTDASADHAKACAVPRVPDDADTGAGQVPHRWTPPMQLPTPMLAMCRIDGRRRPRRDDDDVADQHESGSFSPGDLGLPSAPGFSAIHQPTGDQPVGAGRGICEGRCWGSTPRFSSFCAPGYAPPSGGHSPALPPSFATGEDRRQFITDPGSD